MTVSAQTPVDRSVANGVTTSFPYNFLLLDDGDLTVYLNDSIADPSTYTVTGVGAISGGSVNFTAAPPAGVVVSRIREMTLQRLIDYQNAGDFMADTVDADFDRLWMVLQDSNARYSRSIHVGVDDSTPFDDLELPMPDVRAGLFLAFDSIGRPIAATGTGADAGLRTDLSSGTDSLGDALIAVRRSLTGAKKTALHDWIETQHINVKADFGAVGDGITDDSYALIAAYAAAAAGAVVYWPPGNYKISKSIYYKANTRTEFARGAVLKPSPISDFDVLTFPGKGDWGYAIFVNEHWTAAALTDANVIFDGVCCQPDSPFNGHVIVSRMVNNLRIYNGVASDCADYNATLACIDVVVANNWATGMTNCSYDFWEGCGYVIVKNNFARNCNCGVNWNSTDTYNTANLAANNCLIDGNYIFGGPGAAIFLSPLSSGSTINNVRITNNYINQNLSAGGPGSNPSGIVVQRSSAVSMQGNTIASIGNGMAPIIVTGDAWSGVSESCDIRDNVIIGSTLGAGAYIQAYGTDHQVIGNRAYSSSASIGVVADSPTTVIALNKLLGATIPVANQTSTGTPTTPALFLNPDTTDNRWEFQQDAMTQGGLVQSTGYALTATGTDQATAFAIAAQYSYFSTVASGTGARLPAANSSAIGKEFVVWNAGANTLTLYAPSGATISGSSSQTIAANAKLRVVCVTTNLYMIAGS